MTKLPRPAATRISQPEGNGPEMTNRDSRPTTAPFTPTEDASQVAIRWRLATEVAQHPVTTLALGAFALSGIYLLVLTPVLGGDVIAAVALGVSGTITVANFGYRYRKEYAIALSRLLDEQAEERARLLGVGLRLRHQSLREGFDAVGHTEGVTALDRLTDEYERLDPSLNYRNGSDLFAGPHVEELTDETYRRGISVLADALTLVEAIQTPGVDEIEGQIDVLETEITALVNVEDQAERLAIKKNVLASQHRRLAELKQLQVNVDELLYQSYRCEVSLSRTRIELAAIKTGNSGSGVNLVITALEGTIRRAKEVQEELKGLGF